MEWPEAQRFGPPAEPAEHEPAGLVGREPDDRKGQRIADRGAEHRGQHIAADQIGGNEAQQIVEADKRRH